MAHVFVYGTLLFPEILNGLTGRTFPDTAATLPGYKRLRVKYGDYPAVVAAEGEQVQGKLIPNVDARSLEMLRFYEGDDYECVETFVHLEHKKVKAMVFVWKNDRDLLTGPDWSMQKFRHHFLPDYIRYVIPETVAEFTRLFS